MLLKRLKKTKIKPRKSKKRFSFKALQSTSFTHSLEWKGLNGWKIQLQDQH
uniref:Uncharacterized protein n=1 Tax=Tetranychus urticae TaxID=32264 RepID=T1JU55_TETUR